MSELITRQILFVKCLTKLFFWIYFIKEWEITLAEGYIGDSIDKPTEDTPHKRNGNHFKRLALDINLIVQGKMLILGTEKEWVELGIFWENIHPLCRWGGRFGDSNHLSVEFEGIK